MMLARDVELMKSSCFPDALIDKPDFYLQYNTELMMEWLTSKLLTLLVIILLVYMDVSLDALLFVNSVIFFLLKYSITSY